MRHCLCAPNGTTSALSLSPRFPRATNGLKRGLLKDQLHRRRIHLKAMKRGRGRLRATPCGLPTHIMRLRGRLRVRLVPLLDQSCFLQIRIVSRADLLLMGFHIIQHLGFQRPSKKVELSDRRHEGLMIRNGEHDPFPTAVGVEILFRIRLQLSLVAKIDEKLLTMKRIPNKGLPTVFRHKPVNDPKTQRRLAIQILKDLIDIGLVRIETLKTRDDEFRLTFHLFSACLWIRYIGLHD